MQRIRRRAAITAFIAAGWLNGGGASPQEEFAPTQLAACTNDIRTYCSTVRIGGGRTLNCLRDNKSHIAAECEAAIAPSDYPGTNGGVTITVTVDKIRAQKGFVYVTLSDDPKKFPFGRRTIIAPVGKGTVVATFRHLKPATYAISAYHDENDNGKFDWSLLSGSEGFGASNGVVGLPDFAASAVKVVGNTSLAVSMKYP